MCSIWLTCQNNGTSNYNITLNVCSCQCIETFYGPNCQYRTLNSTTFINSTILTQELGVSLMNLIGVPLNSVATKIYQASVHGFSASQFHSKVDGKLGTLSIIKSTNGNIFGGFTMLSWGLPTNSYNDPKAFLFSLINPQKHPYKLNQINKNDYISINVWPPYGPIFGAGRDLFISENSNSNFNSYSSPGYSYQLPLNITKGTTASYSFLDGTQFFQTVEIACFNH